MGAVIIDGRERAGRLRIETAADVATLITQHDIYPTLATILVGDDPASAIYVKRKAEQAEEVGIRSLPFRLPADTDTASLLGLVAALNVDPDIHGILVQLPLPAQIDRATILDAIDPRKDVDGFHITNAGQLAVGGAGFVPCTPAGCMILLTDYLTNLRGRHAVVVGSSTIVGRPMAQLLLQAHCTVTIAHIHSVDLAGLVELADILVVAAGSPGLIRGDWLKPGVVIIDVGINRVTDPITGAARIVGDVRFDEAVRLAGAITPVPGGVGPMTIACLLRNTVTAAKQLERRPAFANLPAPTAQHRSNLQEEVLS